MWQLALAGTSLGLAGSLHCVGMCGPLALSLPIQHLNSARQAIAMIFYHAGRVITYSLIGLLLGLAGRGLYLAGWQQWFSIILGTTMLLLSIRFYFLKKMIQPRWLQPLYSKVQQLMGLFLQPRPPAGYLAPGIINGFLPCGMVYLALAGALSTSRVTDSVLFMFFFGTGTLPAML
ncbi:MAG TPA: sulfite exporter TauE/SafE family protein, partial [Chitinophagaceae bacterium]|nr:sulfite exporter TauE/SafE family protein [Chitinophagaceae bacterium]